MTPEQVAEALRLQDFFFAALGVRFGVPMGDVRQVLVSRQDALPAAEALRSPDAAGGEGATALPADPSPETVNEAGGFDSHSLTEIVVKRGFESRPDASASMGGPTGIGRSDGEQRPAAEGAAVPSAPITETPPPSDDHEGEEEQERMPASDGGPEGSSSQLQLTSGAGAQLQHSLQAERENSPPAGEITTNAGSVGTQAPPVGTVQEPPAHETADPLRSEAATRKDAGPAAPEPKKVPREGTVAARVAAFYRQHPEYTARQAAEALEITKGSLAGTSHALQIKWRKEADALADRQFTTEAELRAHYAGVAKRLGKA